MKKCVDILRKNNIVCKKLQKIELNTRKKINAYMGVNIKNEYCIVFEILKKSRFLNKDYEELLKFLPDVNFRYKKKILILHSPICSRVKEKMKEWKIILTDNI
ncbi:conserved hypothetical protein [Lebetimonas natsushimae]|uniref:Uncharacterized protein n=1 Tax=Lebetimonas natsushimae TaxID=1936991 RepID=A0A292YGB6_9BACT|nr:hypothetical protein [Lebetimonas natsushimae]GAX87965.1 conserved hypothetical protein [Lebetimonas natsushimae]